MTSIIFVFEAAINDDRSVIAVTILSVQYFDQGVLVDPGHTFVLRPEVRKL